MTLHCPKCGSVVLENASFCAYCGTPIRIVKPVEVRQSGFPAAGGVLEILAACLCVIVGLIGVTALALVSYYYINVGLWFMGAISVVGFAFGLVGGVCALKRMYFVTAALGSGLVMLSGFVDFLALTISFNAGIFLALLGTPIVILSTISLIFIAISKAEFA